jgi:hypothetical protein
LSQYIINIRTKPTAEIADEGKVEYHAEHSQVIETFSINQRTVAKIKIGGVDLCTTTRSRRSLHMECQISRVIEEAITENTGEQSPLEIEHHVATDLSLRREDEIGGRTHDYFKRARDLAQQQLFSRPTLEAEMREKIQTDYYTDDLAYQQMLRIVRNALPTRAENPYHEARRDEHAASAGLLHSIWDVDIVMILDAADAVLVFQLPGAFANLLSKDTQQYVADSLESYSTLVPVPFPDKTLSGPHWSLWLPSRPDLDFRSAGGAKVRCAKSGVYQFGMRPSSSHADTRREDAYKNRIPCPALARDSMPLDDETDEQKLARRPLCHSTLSACNELSSFLLSLLDPDLRRLRERCRYRAETYRRRVLLLIQPTP